jgi:hypothetical protein
MAMTNHMMAISGMTHPVEHIWLGVSQLTMPNIKNKGAGANSNVCFM